MEKFFLPPTDLTPEINFSPAERIFYIRGNSAPEDVRALYYPVTDWIKGFTEELLAGKYPEYSSANPMKFIVDLYYFNSSSAKFLYDIFYELKRITDNRIPIVVKWYYEQEDIDMKEAGEDIAMLVEMEFHYISK